MRLFIAINFNNDTRSRLIALRDELHANSVSGNFSAPENLHLTLAFLGECDAGQTAAVKTIMDGVAFKPFPVAVERVGRFKRDGGDIWWAGLCGSARLLELQRELTQKLLKAGFELDARKYSPHITLGREVVLAPEAVGGQRAGSPDTVSEPGRGAGSPGIIGVSGQGGKITPFGETVSRIDLMKSERIGGKLTYTPIHSKM
jgi:2'-5' RNA ligase